MNGRIFFVAMLVGMSFLAYGLLGMQIWPPVTMGERSAYLLSLVIGAFGIGLPLRALIAHRANRFHLPVTLALFLAFGAGILWALTEEPMLTNFIAGWVMLGLIAWAALFTFLGGTSRRWNRVPIGTVMEDGRTVLSYTRDGRMVSKVGEMSTAEFLAKRHPAIFNS